MPADESATSENVAGQPFARSTGYLNLAGLNRKRRSRSNFMGMYTELVMGVELRKDVPTQVIETLRFMLGERPDEPTPLPEHPLFGDTRWRHMLLCDSYYFDGDTMHAFRKDEIADAWFLTVRCNLKNYDNEIEKFCDWLEPYMNTEGFYGYKRYEEAEVPTLLFNGAEAPPPDSDNDGRGATDAR